MDDKVMVWFTGSFLGILLLALAGMLLIAAYDAIHGRKRCDELGGIYEKESCKFPPRMPEVPQ